MQQIGRYEIVDKLGQGGFGAVYRGRDPGINRLVAIKVMSEATASDPAMLARFKREAEAAGGLNHRNIVTIYELGEHEGQPFIAMEYLEGRDLAALLSSRIELPLEQRIDMLAQIADGLHYAHNRGIVHRDVKAANVRVLDDGTAKIMDFGIARLSDSEMTKTGMVMGTVNYMAPEQLQGKKVDARADQFSLGVLGYELLSFRRPFPGDSISAVLFSIVHDQPKPLSEMQNTSYPAAADVVMRCLEKDPAQRWPSCLELAEALREFLPVRGTSGSIARSSMTIEPPTEAAPEDSSAARARPASAAQRPPSVARPESAVHRPTAASTSDGEQATVEYDSSVHPPAGAGAPATTPSAQPQSGSPGRTLYLGAGGAVLVIAALAVGYLLFGPDTPSAPAAAAGTISQPSRSTDPPLQTSAPPQPAPAPAGAGPDAPTPDETAAAQPTPALAQPEATQAPTQPAVDQARASAEAEAHQRAQRAARVESAAERARKLESSGNSRAALAAWREVLELDPSWPGARDAVRQLDQRLARERVAAAASQLRASLDEAPLNARRLDSRLEELRQLDPQHPLLAEIAQLRQALTRAREALAASDPDTAKTALAGLDGQLPAVRELATRARDQIARRDAARAELGRARTAAAAGRRDEALRLAGSAAAAWPPLQTEADSLIASQRAAAPEPAPSARPAANPRQQIEALLSRYAAALEAKDLDALRRTWPSLPDATASRIRSSFEFSRNHQVELSVLEVELREDSATVNCQRRDRIETRDGQQVDNASRASFELRRGADGWVISDLR